MADWPYEYKKKKKKKTKNEKRPVSALCADSAPRVLNTRPEQLPRPTHGLVLRRGDRVTLELPVLVGDVMACRRLEQTKLGPSGREAGLALTQFNHVDCSLLAIALHKSDVLALNSLNRHLAVVTGLEEAAPIGKVS